MQEMREDFGKCKERLQATEAELVKSREREAASRAAFQDQAEEADRLQVKK